jgi:hypothetical protein
MEARWYTFLDITSFSDDDINRIARWIKNGCSKNEIYGIDENIIYEAIKDQRVSFLGIPVKMRKETD